MENKILVVGSINVDLVFNVENFPKLDQTILSNSFSQLIGGKGFNQSVACKKLGLNVDLMSKIGNDLYGEMIIDQIDSLGFDQEHIFRSQNKLSGLASIYLDKKGDKQIVVLPGANYDLLSSDLDSKEKLIKNSDFIISQLELPIITIESLLSKAKNFGKKTILNACPGRKLTKKIFENTDYLIINSLDLDLISNVKGSKEEKIFKICENFSGVLIVKDFQFGYYYVENKTLNLIKNDYLLEARNSLLDDDIFISIFVYCLVNKWNLQKSIITSSNCTKKFIESKMSLEDLNLDLLDYES